MRWGLIGASNIAGEWMVGALRAVGDEVVAVVSGSAERARQFAAQHGIAHALTNETDLATLGIDAVYVSSTNDKHEASVLHAASHGWHVLCEKPVALTLADAAAVRDAADKAGRVFQVAFHHRFSAEHAAIERLLAADVLGRIEAFHSVICEPIDVIPGGEANYRYDPVQGGGLTLVDMGMHRLDQMRALLGEVDEVHCRMGSVLEGHDLDDSIVLSLRMRSGAIGSLGFHRFSRGYFSPCTLAGTGAVANFSGAVVNPYQSAPVSVFLEQPPERLLPPDVLAWTRPDRWWGESRPGWVELWPPRINTFEALWNAFFDAIEAERDAVPGPVDGYRALEIVQAAYRSHAEGRPIRLPLDPGEHAPPPRFKHPS